MCIIIMYLYLSIFYFFIHANANLLTDLSVNQLTCECPVQCWAKDPAERPTFVQVYQRVSAIMPDTMKVVQAWEEDGGLAVTVNDVIAVIDGRCVNGSIFSGFRLCPMIFILFTNIWLQN